MCICGHVCAHVWAYMSISGHIIERQNFRFSRFQVTLETCSYVTNWSELNAIVAKPKGIDSESNFKLKFYKSGYNNCFE